MVFSNIVKGVSKIGIRYVLDNIILELFFFVDLGKL